MSSQKTVSCAVPWMSSSWDFGINSTSNQTKRAEDPLLQSLLISLVDVLSPRKSSLIISTSNGAEIETQIIDGINSCKEAVASSQFEDACGVKENAKYAAYELFGEMRDATDEENSLYDDMLKRMSKPLDLDIFSL